MVDVRHWVSAKSFLDGMAFSQITPGPIVITATFIGYQMYGVLGACLATLGIFLPSFVLVVGVTPHFDRLAGSPYFRKAISGVLCSFVGLLLSVMIRFAFDITWDPLHIVLAGTSFVGLLFNIEVYWVVLGATLLSLLFAWL